MAATALLSPGATPLPNDRPSDSLFLDVAIATATPIPIAHVAAADGEQPFLHNDLQL